MVDTDWGCGPFAWGRTVDATRAWAARPSLVEAGAGLGGALVAGHEAA